MKPGSTPRSIRENVFDYVFPDTIGCNTPNCALSAAGGNTKQNEVNLTGGVAAVDNLFKLTSAARILQVYGVCTAKTDSTKFDDVKFQIYDGANAVDLCATVAASGIDVGDLLIKNADDGQALLWMDASAGEIYTEGGTAKKAFSEGIASANGANTYLRLSYTGDADTDITIAFVVRYQPMTSTAEFEAV